MEFELTGDMIKRVNTDEAITIADIELLCLRFTVRVSKIHRLAYEVATYVEVGDCLDSTYIDGAIIDHGSDLQAEIDKYLSNMKDKFKAAARQLTVEVL